VTVKEIARLAGVSIGTVDRVLHDRGEVSPETKDRIQAIVRKLGYQPNMMARHLSLNKRYAFTVVMPGGTQDSGFWVLAMSGIRKAASELSPFNVDVRIVEFDRNDRPAYDSLTDILAREPGDGLLIAPVLPGATLDFLNRLPAGIPYVFFDGRVDGARPLTAIGQDAFSSGVLAGRLMSLMARKTGTICAIATHEEDLHIRRRIEGFRSFFNRGKSVVSISECFDIEKVDTCSSFLDRLFRQYPDIAGIFVSNASGHTVAEYLRLHGIKERTALVGYDLVPENIRNLRDGYIDCLVSQRPEYQGYLGINQLYRSVVLAQSCEAEIQMPLDVFFKENLQASAIPSTIPFYGTVEAGSVNV